MQKPTIRGVRSNKRKPRRTAAQWEQIISDWRGSGQSADEYVRAHDLHAGTLSWASRFGRGLRDKHGSRPEQRSSLFLPVRVSGRARRCQSWVELSAGSGVEVVLSNGRSVRLSGKLESQSLTRLLAVVEAGV